MLNEGPPNRASGEIGSGSAGAPRPAERRGDAANGSSAFTVTPPKLELPKGGGAVRGMGEKFAANPVTGTGSLNVPIAISPGRSGFAPQLALEYDSGAGNGPFGLGFDLSLPAITRKTEKGLPRYQDTTDSDVFLLSGAEDLVPCIEELAGVWQPQVAERRLYGETYRVAAYRPRIEGLFARIERWSHTTDAADVFWRSISRDNVTTWYGKTDESRITDPTDARRIFSWLICESYDDRGNAMSYGYKRESSQGVVATSLHERNRTDVSRGANRYLKRIQYGNRQPHWPNLTAPEPTPLPTDWMFEVVFDYGEHDRDLPVPSEEVKAWPVRSDPFSSCRAGFELRTYRLCQRVLMFHHFPTELEVGANCLVRSTEFTYAHAADPTNAQHPILSRIISVTQAGHRRDSDGLRWKKTLPPLELEFSAVQLSHRVEEADVASLENLPAGLDGASYQWVDLDGEGLSGILTQQAGALWYKRNLGPLAALDVPEPSSRVRFGPAELVAEQPSLLALEGGTQLLDLNGNGNLDAVELDGATPGFFTRGATGGWEGHRTFPSLPRLDWGSPNLRFVDLTGDGQADVLITEDDALCWYPSLGEAGFEPAQRVVQAIDEEAGPRLVFADGTQSIFLADLSGDGLTDLVRIRNGEVCYWPNLGYGRFGAKVSMDSAPWFDHADQFDQRRVRLADIDGDGTVDIVYLGADGVDLYFNQSGNAWSAAQRLQAFPAVDDLATVQVLDLLGNGTACLVWSSPLAGAGARPLRYVDLMGGQKPHLLIKSANNLGAETRLFYTPSTRFYLEDQRAGRPWISKLPFPVHALERVETLDRLSGNRFVTRYAYHHGYFDGIEREFRGFGCVEQWDTEELATLTATGELAQATNYDAQSHVPPVLTRTWFHTGMYLDAEGTSSYFAGLLNAADTGEYYRERVALNAGDGGEDARAAALLLPDTPLPEGLTLDERREACRALKGSMLRQEVYALDGTQRQDHPYTVTEQNFSLKRLQPKMGNRHAVFLSHARESLTYHYERNPADPRTQHALTLEVDDFGNVSRSAAVTYGRRARAPELSLAAQDEQAAVFVTYQENRFTNPVREEDSLRAPLPCESSSHELSGLAMAAGSERYSFEEVAAAGSSALEIAYEEGALVEEAPPGVVHKRCIERVRTLYRPNDLGLSRGDALALLPFANAESMALSGESYKLAFTPGLLDQVYGVRVTAALLLEGRYVHADGGQDWWLRSGRTFFSPDPGAAPSGELAFAREHFFIPRRYRDPFHVPTSFETESVVHLDAHDLLPVGARDALGNEVSSRNDYRVLQPTELTDANHNRSAVAFDTLGLVVGTAVMGKADEDPVGDSLLGFLPDLEDGVVQQYLAEPLVAPQPLLLRASTRILYDLFGYYRTRDNERPAPPTVAVIARETHAADPGGAQTRVQCAFSYSDGFGREIQKKAQAEAGPLAPGGLAVDPRWVGSGWTIFNNKGKPVRQYEPFFSETHRFERDVQRGVSPILFYDPLERVVATAHPNHTWQKVVFDAWAQVTWDVNDTVLIDAPELDVDVGDLFRRLPASDYSPSWYRARIDGVLGEHERAAAQKAAAHADTPNQTHLDSLGRAFLSIAHNRVDRGAGPVDELYATRIAFDIEGNQREVSDAKGRVVMRYDYDLLGNQARSASMEAGERWMLNDVMGQPIRAWDSRGFVRRLTYDSLRRPTELFVTENGAERLAERTVYGETLADGKNHRGRVHQQFDAAGVVTHLEYDFKGNLLGSRRDLLADYRRGVDWSQNPPANDGTFTNGTTYDALNRPVSITSPDGSVYQPTFNAAGLLEMVEVSLRGAAATSFITEIDYDAKGQRQSVAYGNGATTEYQYDPLTFRLVHLRTTRPTGPDAMASQIFSSADVVQDLSYVYDPSGNITRVEDAALQVIFRDGRVEPAAEYTYDAVYQLIEATGREHIGQTAFALEPANGACRDYPFIGNRVNPNDARALRNYSERYVYDAVGNFDTFEHSASGAGWTRRYEYGDDSLLDGEAEVGQRKKSNRLTATSMGGPGNPVERYAHDAHGNMVSMPHLSSMVWDYRDQLVASARQVVNDGVPETTYYVYDSSGQRVRKVTESAAAVEGVAPRKNERVYLGGFEVYRDFDGGGSSVVLERESLHVMDGEQRVALVETQTIESGSPVGAPVPLQRYQLGNHLGSSSVELDASGGLIAYEEYHPYGTSSFQAGRSAAEVSLKRYRYTGMERDEETGLGYHSARYYAGWLGRWVSADPAGQVDGPNVFRFVKNRPTTLIDRNGRQPGLWFLFTIANVQAPTHEGDIHEDNAEEIYAAGLAAPIVIPSALAAGEAGVLATAGLLTWSAANSGVLALGAQFAVGLIDPNPAGSVDFPGPADDAGRVVRGAATRMLREGTEAVSQTTPVMPRLGGGAAHDARVLLPEGERASHALNVTNPNLDDAAEWATDDALQLVVHYEAKIGEGKWAYLFGEARGAKNAAHNIPRTTQNGIQMDRLGLHGPEGIALLQRHFDDVVVNPATVLSSSTNRWGTFEVRSSVFFGPSGQAAQFTSTWQVLENGARRLTTVIPEGGPKQLPATVQKGHLRP